MIRSRMIERFASTKYLTDDCTGSLDLERKTRIIVDHASFGSRAQQVNSQIGDAMESGICPYCYLTDTLRPVSLLHIAKHADAP